MRTTGKVRVFARLKGGNWKRRNLPGGWPLVWEVLKQFKRVHRWPLIRCTERRWKSPRVRTVYPGRYKAYRVRLLQIGTISFSFRPRQ